MSLRKIVINEHKLKDRTLFFSKNFSQALFFPLAWLGIIFRAFLKYRNFEAIFDPKKRISFDYEADELRTGGVAGVIADVFAQQKRGQILALKTAEALTLPIGAFNPVNSQENLSSERNSEDIQSSVKKFKGLNKFKAVGNVARLKTRFGLEGKSENAK